MKYKIAYENYISIHKKPKDLRMYILVNKDIKLSKGKLGSQIGHAVNVLTYNYCKNKKKIIDEYMNGHIRKIILYATQDMLEDLEAKNHVAIRDAGFTELEPNSLTCVNLGIIDFNNIPKDVEFIKELKLV